MAAPRPAPDLVALDGLAQAALVRAGAATPADLLEAAIARAEALNPRLNAIVLPMYDQARRSVAAGLPDGPFRGVPVLLKDSFATYAGFPTSNGCRLFKDKPAERDSELVTRLKRSGAAIFGKTNCPELGSLGTTEPALFGPTRNPWNPEHSSGGSSGGSAAAVAARIAPIAHGSDGAGSIRIPASCCGLVGLKPTRARITLAPHLGESINGILSEGVVTLSVRDTAAMLDALAGPAPGDPYAAPPSVRPFLAETSQPVRRLKIALTRRSLTTTAVHPDCVAAADDAARLCEALGHDVVEDRPPLEEERWYATYRRFWPLAPTRNIRRVERERGDARAVELFEPFNRYCYELGSRISAMDYVLDLEWFQSVTRGFGGWMDERGYDAWLTPTLGLPPPPLGFFDAGVHGGPKVLDRFMEFLPFTPFANMTGQPAITLPLWWNVAGLPIGVQFAARHGGENVLLALAAQLEAARPWLDRKPPVCA